MGFNSAFKGLMIPEKKIGVQINDNISRTLKFVILEASNISLFQYYTYNLDFGHFFVSKGKYGIVSSVTFCCIRAMY